MPCIDCIGFTDKNDNCRITRRKLPHNYKQDIEKYECLFYEKNINLTDFK